MSKPKEFKFKQQSDTVYTAVQNDKGTCYTIQFCSGGMLRHLIQSTEWINQNDNLFKLDGSGRW